jgi:hypothetical protein
MKVIYYCEHLTRTQAQLRYIGRVCRLPKDNNFVITELCDTCMKEQLAQDLEAHALEELNAE